MTLHNKHSLRIALIFIITIFYFLANIQRVAIPGAMFNVLQGDFATDASRITMLGAIFCYIYAFTQLIVGLMVDRFGGFRVISIGCSLFALGALIFPFSESLLGLYISRALVGFGAATFYISTIREVKLYAKDKNFSLALSYILFIGYSGGIIANAPFVALVHSFGWRDVLGFLGYFTLLLAIIYLIIFFVFKPIRIERDVKFSFSPFKEVLKNPKNINLYIYGCINYGLYYVLQSVIGNKFLQDFCHISLHKSAIILSIMALVSALAGTVVAATSRAINNRRAIIFKIFSIFSFISTLIVFLLLVFNIQTKIIALIFFIPSIIGNISALLIPTLHCINRYEISATAVSVQNFCFFMMVGLLGMLSGMLMNMYEPLDLNGVLIYSNNSYMLVFGLFLVLSVAEMFCAFRIKDYKKS